MSKAFEKVNGSSWVKGLNSAKSIGPRACVSEFVWRKQRDSCIWVCIFGGLSEICIYIYVCAIIFPLCQQCALYLSNTYELVIRQYRTRNYYYSSIGMYLHVSVCLSLSASYDGFSCPWRYPCCRFERDWGTAYIRMCMRVSQPQRW